MAPLEYAGRVALQIWDRTRQERNRYPPRNWFDLEDGAVVRATYTAYPVPSRVKMPDAHGGSVGGYIHGYVSLRLDGKSHSLEATELEGGGLFIQFRDATNETETFPDGRYLETQPAAEDGAVILDFNRAFNPPCAFSEFVACTLAPKSNAVRSPIRAGERFSRTR